MRESIAGLRVAKIAAERTELTVGMRVLELRFPGSTGGWGGFQRRKSCAVERCWGQEQPAV